jgi:DNA-binding NarL/FixJ family response regulator
VRAVAAGAAMLAPPIAAQLLDRILESPEPPTALDALSDREREVLGLLAVGKSHGEIAGALSISPSTVRSHLHHVVTKLNVRHRVEAVTLAYQLGLVDGP